MLDQGLGQFPGPPCNCSLIDTHTSRCTYRYVKAVCSRAPQGSTLVAFECPASESFTDSCVSAQDVGSLTEGWFPASEHEYTELQAFTNGMQNGETKDTR